ncbi:MAG: hypothetical protein IPP47_19190 [Bryobacterales bacterium]|nr:hypothetical protein [Bryobacterales bacterium]
MDRDGLADRAGLDKGIARRVKQSIERFAETGAGNLKRLQAIKNLSRGTARFLYAC